MAVSEVAPRATWHRNVWAAFVSQLLASLAYSIALGSVFDVYIFKLGGGARSGNSYVGAVESVNGLVALACAIPVGFIVDSWDRVCLMKIAAVIGLSSALTASWALACDNLPAWYLTMILFGVYTELADSVTYALFADSVEPAHRPKATSTLAIINSVAWAAGPALSLFAFLYIGDQWEMYQLKAILWVGFVVFVPVGCLSMLAFTKAPYEGTPEAESEDEEENVSSRLGKRSFGARAVPFLVASSDFIAMIGAGMTVKYFDLYWKEDWHMSPAQVLGIAVVQPLSIALFIKMLEWPAARCGRAQSAFSSLAAGVGAFVVLARTNDVSTALFSYFVRAGFANAMSPINKSIMFDFTPSEQRGRWNAVESLSGSVWSGSAFIGGLLANRYDYRATFLITAGVYVVAGMIYSPLLAIVPRKSSSEAGSNKDPSLSHLSHLGKPLMVASEEAPAIIHCDDQSKTLLQV